MKLVVCNHILEENFKPTLVYNNCKYIQLLCENTHNTENIRFIKYEELVKIDNSLEFVLSLKDNHCLERENIESLWAYYYDYSILDIKSNYELGIKEKNDVLLESLNFEEFLFLPAIKSQKKTRKIQDIKNRAFAISIILKYANNLVSSDNIFKYIDKHSLYDIFTKDELEFLKSNDINYKINESWKQECLAVFLYFFKFIEKLDISKLMDLTEVNNYPLFINTNTIPSFLDISYKVNTIDYEKIIELYDLYSRLDYICDFNYFNKIENFILDSAMIYERRYALFWLTQKCDWDTIKLNSIY